MSRVFSNVLLLTFLNESHIPTPPHRHLTPSPSLKFIIKPYIVRLSLTQTQWWEKNCCICSRLAGEKKLKKKKKQASVFSLHFNQHPLVTKDFTLWLQKKKWHATTQNCFWWWNQTNWSGFSCPVAAMLRLFSNENTLNLKPCDGPLNDRQYLCLTGMASNWD